MLLNVLTEVAKDTGLHPTQQRDTLLRLLNKAAHEMHTLLECNAINREVTLVVRPDAIVALPPSVGKLIGVRKLTNDITFDISTLGFPRYVRDTRQYTLNGWRLLGDSPIQALPPSGSTQFLLSTQTIEDAEVTIRGNTFEGTSVEETITLDVQLKLGNTLFGRNIERISSESVRTADIQIYSADGTVLMATLYNNMPQTKYKLVDVSEVCWSQDTTDGESLIDVLYKLPEIKFERNTDTFYAGDEYDNAWYFMTMHYFFMGQSDKTQSAKEYRAFAINAMKMTKADMEGNLDKRVTFGPNKYIEAQRYYDNVWK